MTRNLKLNRRRFIAGATAGAAAAALASSPLAVMAQGKPIRIGWTAWSDAEVVTNIAKIVLEQRLGQKVELVMTDVALQYAALERGQIDLMLMAWLPGTHKSYWRRSRTTSRISACSIPTPSSAGPFPTRSRCPRCAPSTT